MKSVALKSFPRNASRRNQVKKIRDQGRIPAVIYGRHNPPQSLEVEYVAIDSLLKHAASENLVVDLAVENDSRPSRKALLKDVQHHVLTGRVLHVDFQEVAEDEKVIVTVPVESVGEAVGVKVGGGVLEHVLFKIKVRALPKDLPEVIYVDVASLEAGQSIHMSDLPAPEGVEFLGDAKTVVMSVAIGRAQRSEDAAEAGSTAAPGAGAAPAAGAEAKKK